MIAGLLVSLFVFLLNPTFGLILFMLGRLVFGAIGIMA